LQAVPRRHPLALSDVLPILENLGLRVLGEFPYRLRHANGREFWIHDFAFTAAEGLDLDIQQLNDTLQDAFVHIVMAMPRTMRSTAWC
jgi:glutamate dehydrogenase